MKHGGQKCIIVGCLNSIFSKKEKKIEIAKKQQHCFLYQMNEI